MVKWLSILSILSIPFRFLQILAATSMLVFVSHQAQHRSILSLTNRHRLFAHQKIKKNAEQSSTAAPDSRSMVPLQLSVLKLHGHHLELKKEAYKKYNVPCGKQNCDVCHIYGNGAVLTKGPMDCTRTLPTTSRSCSSACLVEQR